MKKVVVIGLDGLDPTIVETMLASGALPNLARLRAAGGFSRLATTTPAQTPVAWSTFATGVNPGGHGIFDFLGRDPQTYLPDLALNRHESRGVFQPPAAVNLRGGTPVWELLGNSAVNSAIVRCPCTYPPDPVQGRMLCGMGVPDLRGGFGTPTFYTTSADASPRESENVIRLVQAEGGRFETHLIGPRRPRDQADLRFDFSLEPDQAANRVLLRSSVSPEGMEIRVGQWSDWLRVGFKSGLFQTVRGIVRFHLIRLEPELEFYASPVNFDPDAPLFPISYPADYASELAENLGLFHTSGMVEDHTGLNNERLDEAAFLDQCDLAWRERESMLLHELTRADDGLVFCLFDTPDRVQHMFWRYREPDHPANRGKTLSTALAKVIEDHYRRGDDVVGKALEFADDETLVIVLSDHGFGGFRRGVNLNTLLFDLGLLAMRDGSRPGPDCRDLLRDVDWSRTRAYALGLSGLYLNLEGREAQGAVKAADAEGLKAAIAGSLTRLVDPASGDLAIHRVRPRESVYSGPFVSGAPDLLVDFAPGYRVSWGSSLGGASAAPFEDNTRKWSGDHIVDPRCVPGVLFMNRPFRQTDADLKDMAPTILDALGVARGPLMEGSSLLR